ncbi:MAG: peptidoglycan DD-metalloendopeptidase family protein [Bacillota bacterium]|nr:peptidoglycan DD-metalloendopeptidase family protein [Bacillota bacterium]HHU62033.1 peptidoglycan DD-metalloendopeptidase family protein [Natronincola sp.]
MRYRLGLILLIVSLLLPTLGVSLCEAKVLRKGMHGTDIQNLQGLLSRLGYELSIDGIFGTETEELIRGIQASMGLKADGIVGRLTFEVLDQLEDGVLPYTVQGGDNLSVLAVRYNTTVKNIITYNSLANPDRILLGQTLYIPTSDLAVFSRSTRLKPTFQWPVRGRISSGYGYRIHPIYKTRQFHGGIDIAVPEGTPVKAAATGKVIQAGVMGNLGLSVVLQHLNGFTSWYGHNSKLNVKVGDEVRVGDTIAYVGRTGSATGPHLDFRIKKGDQTLDPMDWLP